MTGTGKRLLRSAAVERDGRKIDVSEISILLPAALILPHLAPRATDVTIGFPPIGSESG
jgi:hypothetical protein